uniref:hypothetical protein n=1 Tax=Nonomuraea sp. CA-251285 TaxID=3240002 RepID=UPI003F497457
MSYDITPAAPLPTGELMLVDPAGRPVVVLGEHVRTVAEAEQRYVEVWARLRRDQQRGAPRPADQTAARVLGEALAHQRGSSLHLLQVRFRAEVAAAYWELVANA